MNQTFPVRAIAGAFALASFCVAIVSGLAADRAAADILATAIYAMLIGQAVGCVGGWAIARAIDENVRAYRRAHPLPQAAPGGAPPAAREGAVL